MAMYYHVGSLNEQFADAYHLSKMARKVMLFDSNLKYWLLVSYIIIPCPIEHVEELELEPLQTIFGRS
jgi:hypothetical protein